MVVTRPCVAVIKDENNGDLVFGPFESLEQAANWLSVNCANALANNNTFIQYLLKPRTLT